MTSVTAEGEDDDGKSNEPIVLRGFHSGGLSWAEVGVAGGTPVRQRITHGAEIDFVTPDEMVHFLGRPAQTTRIRETSQHQLDGQGNGVVAVYDIPAGMEFEARRVTLDLGGSADPVTAALALNVAGRGVAYQRSGVRIEYGQPSYGGAVQIPGVQTWGAEQGPRLQNKEVFEVRAIGLTAGAILTVTVEGILTRPEGS